MLINTKDQTLKVTTTEKDADGKPTTYKVNYPSTDEPTKLLQEIRRSSVESKSPGSPWWTSACSRSCCRSCSSSASGSSS